MNEGTRHAQLTRDDFRPARLVTDEQRVRAWFESLNEADRRRSYTLAEIRAAVSIPATRLRVVLCRLRWRRSANTEFGVSTYRGPYETDADQVIRKL
jgi:hypothetical protein